jgi:hypothetical protein
MATKAPWGWGTWLTVGILATVQVAVAASKSPAATTQSQQSANRPLPSASGPAQPIVTMKDGRLSLTANNQSLNSILDEISQLTRIAIVDSEVRDRPISVSFTDLEPDQALRLILKENDAFFLIGSDADGKTPASLKAVWVYPRGQGRAIEPIPMEQAASTKELKQQLDSTDPRIRARAIDGLTERDENQARDSVVAALKDSDPTVRTQALYSAENAGIDLPPDVLTNLATNDPAPEVRFLALDSLQGSPAGKAVIEQALHDPNPRVRDAAGQFLQRLQASRSPPVPSTQPNPYAH